MPEKSISELEQKISILAKEARKSKKNAKKSKVKNYFEGQSDAFGHVLMELKKLRFALEAQLDENESDNEPKSAKVNTQKRGPRRKVKKTEKTPEELFPAEAALLNEAKACGVIEQKSSHYFHQAFTSGRIPGKVQGRLNVLKELAKEEVAQRIREQITQSTQPA